MKLVTVGLYWTGVACVIIATTQVRQDYFDRWLMAGLCLLLVGILM